MSKKGEVQETQEVQEVQEEVLSLEELEQELAQAEAEKEALLQKKASKKNQGANKIKDRGDYNGRLKLSSFPVDVFPVEIQEKLINMTYREATEWVINEAGGDASKWGRNSVSAIKLAKLENEELKQGINNVVEQLTATSPEAAKLVAELLKKKE
jgi:hypothetical protein